MNYVNSFPTQGMSAIYAGILTSWAENKRTKLEQLGNGSLKIQQINYEQKYHAERATQNRHGTNRENPLYDIRPDPKKRIFPQAATKI